MKSLRGLILFTLLEVVTLVVWLVLAGVPFDGKIAAVIVLAVGLFVEHLVALNVGAGLPPFHFPPGE